MLKRVTLALNSLDPTTWTHHDVPDLLEFLKEQFPTWPANARIYDSAVSQLTDITPFNDQTVDRLAELDGPFYVVNYPGAAAIPYIIGIVLAVASYLLAPSPKAIPAQLLRNSSQSSPNNDLSDRSNKARINGRIADIFGTVNCTPDLIAAPYKVFENNREVEFAYMCIGRGAYDVSDIKDGETSVENIAGTSVAVYKPHTSPNMISSVDNDPQLQIGNKIAEPVLNTKRSNSINGQVLRPPNASTFSGVGNVRFSYPNLVELQLGAVEDFTKFFVDGDVLSISGATMTAGVAVTQQLTCRVSKVDLFYIYNSTPQSRIPTEAFKIYDTDFSLIFDVADTATVYQLFIPGSDIAITDGDALSLSGTYTVSSVTVDGSGTSEEVQNKFPALLIVKLTSPASVNGNWNSLPGLLGTKQALSNPLSSAQWRNITIELSPADSYDIDLNGDYTALSVTKELIVLDSPAAVSSDWSTVLSVQQSTPFLSPVIVSSGEKWVGPYILADDKTNAIIANFVASNGLYTDDGTTQTPLEIQIQLEVTPVDLDDEPILISSISQTESFNITLKGSSTLKETVALTLKATLSGFFGRTSVRARRITLTDTDFEGTVVDEVRWRDMYSVAPVVQDNFGNVTTVYSKTFATASALALKDRKLNMLVTRKIPQLQTDGTFSDELFPTNRADAIFCAICRDHYIGGRNDAELNIQGIYDTVADVEEYFGSEKAVEFCYTFDNDNLSFEETADAVASAMFCTAYRLGNVINLSFEKRTDDSKQLFNHRNKLPGSEARKISFGKTGDYDGIEYTYVSEVDDSVLTVFLPEDYPAANPKKIESVGVRNNLQAYFHSWREWNKLLYQNTVTEFDATEEAALRIRTDRILVADNTRSGTQDGEVLEVNALELTLSQPVDLTEFAAYVIWLQHTDDSTESIAITAGSTPYKVILDEAPLLPLVTDAQRSARTTYVIVGDEETKLTAFLVSECVPKDRMTNTVRAYNYDERYYSNDPDFTNNVIDEDGYGDGGGYTMSPGIGWGSPPSGALTMVAGSGNYGDKGYQAVGTEFNIGVANLPTGSLTGAMPTGLSGLTIYTLWHDSAFGADDLYLALGQAGSPPAQSAFTSLSFTDNASTPHTLTSASATYSVINNQAMWAWTVGSTQFFTGGDSYALTLV